MADATLAPSICAQCGNALAPMMLACPSCSALVHSAELNQLATEAEQAAAAGDYSAALTSWRRALDLLPPSTRQYASVMARIAQLSRAMDGGAPPPAITEAPPAERKIPRPLAGLGAVGVFIWKFWSIILLVLTKAKFILFGLAKLPTLLSMFAAFGIYWTLWGWPFALGFVLTIYVHEMGHVAALRRYGIPATAPMFIPGFGAFVRLKQAPMSVVEDARVGLAGPIWGLGASAACYGLFFATKVPVFAALAQTSAIINLFNLIPVWTLDGSRGLRALSRTYRFILAIVTLGAVFFAHDQTKVFLLIIGGITGFRAFQRNAPREGDETTLITFVGLVVTLTILASVDVMGGQLR